MNNKDSLTNQIETIMPDIGLIGRNLTFTGQLIQNQTNQIDVHYKGVDQKIPIWIK